MTPRARCRSFARESLDLADAEAFLADAGGDVDVFDGDGLFDTEPDPFFRAIQCDDSSVVTLSGVEVRYPNNNIMSYWDGPAMTLSAEQAAILRQVWVLRAGESVRRLVPGATVEVEGADLVAGATATTTVVTQPMRGFHGRWSGDAQLFWAGGAVGQTLTTSFDAPAGRYRVYATFTTAPDFGTHEVAIAGAVGATVDLFARTVHTSPLVNLGVHTLGSGSSLSVRVTGQHADSTGTAFGLDHLVLLPE